jgi:hypothetical protein
MEVGTPSGKKMKQAFAQHSTEFYASRIFSFSSTVVSLEPPFAFGGKNIYHLA